MERAGRTWTVQVLDAAIGVAAVAAHPNRTLLAVLAASSRTPGTCIAISRFSPYVHEIRQVPVNCTNVHNFTVKWSRGNETRLLSGELYAEVSIRHPRPRLHRRAVALLY